MAMFSGAYVICGGGGARGRGPFLFSFPFSFFFPSHSFYATLLNARMHARTHACTCRNYLRAVPDGVLESSRFSEWMRAISSTNGANGAWGDRKAELLAVSKMLPPLNQILLADLIEHLVGWYSSAEFVHFVLYFGLHCKFIYVSSRVHGLLEASSSESSQLSSVH